MGLFIVAIDGPDVDIHGLTGGDYYGTFKSYEEAASFIELGEYECDFEDKPVILEIEDVTKG